MSNLADNPTGRTDGSNASSRGNDESAAELFVVDTPTGERRGRSFSSFDRHLPANVRRLHTGDDIVDTFRSARRRSVWFAPNDSFVSHLAKAVHEPTGDHRLIILDGTTGGCGDLSNVYFRYVLPASAGAQLLPPDQLAEVLTASHRADLFIAGVVQKEAEVLILFSGDLEPVLVPLSWFVGGERSPEPDFEQLSLEDYGHTVHFGEFEAAADAILYEFDPKFRRRARKKQIATDPTFGGSVRRLRLQKGVSRDDFPGVSAKTVARIERSEVENPRSRTLQAIAKRLGVPVDELGTY